MSDSPIWLISDFNAAFFACWLGLNTALSSQILRTKWLSEYPVDIEPKADGEPADQGFKLEAEDFRWRFGYRDGQTVVWEGTIEVIWAVVPPEEVRGRHGRNLMIDSLEVVVHQFVMIMPDGREVRMEDVEEDWEWGMPRQAWGVMKVSLP